jgi:hypothetical protein
VEPCAGLRVVVHPAGGQAVGAGGAAVLVVMKPVVAPRVAPSSQPPRPSWYRRPPGPWYACLLCQVSYHVYSPMARACTLPAQEQAAPPGGNQPGGSASILRQPASTELGTDRPWTAWPALRARPVLP